MQAKQRTISHQNTPAFGIIEFLYIS